MLRLIKEMFIIGLGVLGVIYLLNPTAGFLELLPDNLPFVGNLDEATAVLLVTSTLRYYGLDLSNLWSRKPAPVPQSES
ncbi:MAG: DUF1232 domain-containing protein [Phototrophicaceae bacterium]